MPGQNTLRYVNGYSKVPTPSVTVSTNAGGTTNATGSYIIKYSSAGTPLWATRLVSGAGAGALASFVDSDSNVYVLIATGAPAAYNADGTIAVVYAAPQFQSGLLLKYNSSGFLQWSAQLIPSGSALSQSCGGISVDSSGNVYITGCSPAVSIYNSDRTLFGSLSNSGSSDVYIVKYNSSGMVQWTARIASVVFDSGFGIATDSSGNAYIVGQGSGGSVAAFNSNGTAFGTQLASLGSNDGFVVKYNTTGTVQWVLRIGGTTVDSVNAIASDSSGNLYITGSTGTTAGTAYNSNGTAANSLNAGVFVIKYNTSGTHQWAASISPNTVGNGYGSAIDSSGNVYVTGNGGSGVAMSIGGTNLPNIGLTDIFVAKYNTSGVFQWATRIGTTSGDFGNAIASDSSGNVYVTGSYGAASVLTIYNAGGGVFGTITSGYPTAGNSFLIKYNTNGIAQYAKNIESMGSDIGKGVSVDSLGNAYSIGSVGASSRFSIYGQSLSIFSSISVSGTSDVFIVNYDRTGRPRWVAKIASTDTDIGYAIATDSSGNVYVTGQGGTGAVVTAFNSDGTAFGTTLANAGGSDIFVVKYNTNGVVQWVARVASTSDDIGYGIATDLSGNVYVTGQGGTGAVVTAFNSDGTAFGTTLANAGGTDAFLVEYDTNGTVQWVTRVASTGDDIGYAISTDPSGNVYMTGQGGSGAIVTAYSSDGTAFGTTLANAGGTDSFVVKYNTTGTVQWVARIASTANDIGYGIGTDSSGNVYVTGQGGTGAVVTAYSSNGTAFGTTLANAGGTDVFVVKYNITGTVQWVARVASTSNDVGYTTTTDSLGNIYIAGSVVSGTTSVFNANGTTYTVLSAGTGTSTWIVKYNTNGVVQWATRITSTVTSVAYSIATDSSGYGRLYVSGLFGNSSSSATIFHADRTVFVNVFGYALIAFDTSGVGLWTQYISGITRTNGVCVNPMGDVSIAGQTASGTMTVYNADLTPYTLVSAVGGSDTQIIKYSSSQYPMWAARITSTASDIGYAIATDSSANVYIVGQGGSGAVVTAFNSDGTAFGTTLANAGGSDVFVAKYNTNGRVQWVARVASTVDDIGYGIATDSSGNVYVTGQGGTGAVVTAYSFNGATGATIANAGGTDVFIVKYNTTGTVQWGARVASTVSDIGFGIATDLTSGNVYVTGQGGTGAVVTAYNSNGTSAFTLANAGGTDVFIAQYNTVGAVQWVARVAQNSTDLGYNIAVNQTTGNMFIVGTVSGTGNATAYNANGTVGRTVGSGAFLAAYNSLGTVQWFTRVSPGIASTSGGGIACDTSGNIYIVVSATGGSSIAYNFNGTAFSPTIARSGPAVVKYNSTGSVQWVASIVGNCTTIATDSSGSIYIGGTANGGVTPYNSDGTLFGSTAVPVVNTSVSPYVVKYDSSGFVQWISANGGLSINASSTASNTNKGIALDSSLNLYATGVFGAGLLTA